MSLRSSKGMFELWRWEEGSDTTELRDWVEGVWMKHANTDGARMNAGTMVKNGDELEARERFRIRQGTPIRLPPARAGILHEMDLLTPAETLLTTGL